MINHYLSKYYIEFYKDIPSNYILTLFDTVGIITDLNYTYK